jgi:hypothetical protein
MGFFNKLEDETKNLFSNIDDGVNDTVGWDKIAAMAAMYFGMPTGGTEGSASGGTNFLSSIFGGSSELAPMNPTDYSRAVEMYPTSSGNIFEPSGMSSSQISSIQNMGDQALLRDQMASRQSMPDFGKQSQQQSIQELDRLNNGGEFSGMRKGQQIPTSLLSSLLDPTNAVKAYRPTLI